MKPLILVIEDEPSIFDNISYVLENDGFKTLWARTAGEGRDIFNAEDIALVVLDIGLPDGSGVELCKEIRKDSDCPIIFLTARSDEVDRIVGLEIGADDYVTKPFSTRELCSRAKAVLRRCPSISRLPEATVKDVKLFNVEEERNQISYLGTVLDLSRYEYQILKLMIGHPGRIYSRKTLMNLVWEEPEASMDRTIDTHVKLIRAKLAKIKPGCPIKTRRGFGYYLADDEPKAIPTK